jgi:hypothetical protein
MPELFDQYFKVVDFSAINDSEQEFQNVDFKFADEHKMMESQSKNFSTFA